MKIKIITMLLVLCYSNYLLAQNSHAKHDNIWLMGTEDDNSDPFFGGTKIDFTTEPATISDVSTNISFNRTNTTMSDTAGNLQFYTNGIRIMNAEGELMENGDGLNPCYFSEPYEEVGLPLPQIVLALPYPNHPNWYVLIHEVPENYETIDTYPENVLVYSLKYTLIDMAENGGLGKVIAKNQTIFEDTLKMGGLTAVRHGNGRDWWIVLNEYGANCKYSMLLSPTGFTLPNRYCLGDNNNYWGVTQAVFSPDGSKYVQSNDSSVSIFDFDRCSGELSNPIALSFDEYTAGIAIAPNSRYLYLSNYLTKLFQFDLYAPDIAASKTLVAEYDGFQVGNMAHTFCFLQLAPDNKIYTCGIGSVVYLNVINQPNLQGVACDVQQHSVPLFSYNNATLPNHPNYRLGALPPERCAWAVGIQEASPQPPPKEGELQNLLLVMPNPASNNFVLHYQLPPHIAFGVIELYNTLGQKVLYKQAPQALHQINVSVADLAAGVYLYRFVTIEGQLASGKIIVNQ